MSLAAGAMGWNESVDKVRSLRWRRVLVTALALAVVFGAALGFRLFRLGTWSFWGDELVTF